MTDSVPPAAPPECDCCNRGASRCELRHPLPGWVKNYGLPETICTDCLTVWYDSGLTDPDEIKRRVLMQEATP